MRAGRGDELLHEVDAQARRAVDQRDARARCPGRRSARAPGAARPRGRTTARCAPRARGRRRLRYAEHAEQVRGEAGGPDLGVVVAAEQPELAARVQVTGERGAHAGVSAERLARRLPGRQARKRGRRIRRDRRGRAAARRGGRRSDARGRQRARSRPGGLADEVQIGEDQRSGGGRHGRRSMKHGPPRAATDGLAPSRSLLAHTRVSTLRATGPMHRGMDSPFRPSGREPAPGLLDRIQKRPRGQGSRRPRRALRRGRHAGGGEQPQPALAPQVARGREAILRAPAAGDAARSRLRLVAPAGERDARSTELRPTTPSPSPSCAPTPPATRRWRSTSPTSTGGASSAIAW